MQPYREPGHVFGETRPWRSIFIGTAAVALTLWIVAPIGASAKDGLDVPIVLIQSSGPACSGAGVIAGLDPKGDGFLSVLAAPRPPYREIDRLYNGQKIAICADRGQWLGVIYGSKGGECAGPSSWAITQAYTGPCPHGWISRGYVRDLPGAVSNPMMQIDPSNPAFQQGHADRLAWETWIKNSPADVRIGAEYWSGQRSLARPQPCGSVPDKSGPWQTGCSTAQKMLAPFDVQRKTEPNYRSGWNAPIQDNGAALQQQVDALASIPAVGISEADADEIAQATGIWAPRKMSLPRRGSDLIL